LITRFTSRETVAERKGLRAGIAASSPDNIYAVVGGIEHWDGTSWTNVAAAVPSNTGGTLFYGVTTLSDGTAIAVGFAQPLAGPNNDTR
jgi:hypothetical protein